MANTTYRDMRFKLDNSSASLTDYTAYIQQVDLDRQIDLIEDTGMTDTHRQYLFGLAGTTFTISGMVNSTTEALFGPLMAAATSVTKTFEYRATTAPKYYNGEVLLTNIKLSGSTNNLQTFSMSATIDGAVNRTAVALV